MIVEVGLAAGAAWLATGDRTVADRLAPTPRRVTWRPTFGGPGWRLAAIAGGVGLIVIAGPVPGLVAGAVAFTLRRRVRAARRRRLARTVRIADLATLRAFAAELGSGLPPVVALRVAGGSAESAVGLRRQMLAAAAADSLGGDAAEVLRGGAGPGSPAAALAAGWSVCRRSGSSLAGPVHRIAEAAAADLRVEREAEAALASARSSARLLAVLPVAGAVLGQLSGSGSIRVLLATGVGQACLVFGTALDLAGLAWLDRLADAAGA